MKCADCGANIYDDVNRCQYCGAYQNQPQQNAYQAPPQGQYQQVYQQPPAQPVVVNVFNDSAGRVFANVSARSRWVAFFLCLFLGYLGAHRFYVGKVGTGILYLLTAGLGGFGWVLDLVFILCGTYKDQQGRRLV